MVDTDSNSDLFIKFAAFGSGVSIVLFLYLFGELIRIDTDIVDFFTNFRPFTFAAVGLLLGYNFGDAYQENATDLKLLYLGAFVTAAILLASIHTGESYANIPGNPPITVMILVAASASGLLRVSPIPSKYPQIDKISNLFADFAPKVYLTAFLGLKYGLSFSVNIIPKTPYRKQGIIAVAIVYGILLVTVVAAAHLILRFAKETQTRGGEIEK